MVIATEPTPPLVNWRAVVVSTKASRCLSAGNSRVSMLLIRFMLVMAPVVLLINGYTKGDWWETALFALSVRVGLSPEMLHHCYLDAGARRSKAVEQKVIVKHLDAIQNFGAMDILCTDKPAP
ncbi:hypothetical protein ACNKHV_26655 [Shigella flexneri]